MDHFIHLSTFSDSRKCQSESWRLPKLGEIELVICSDQDGDRMVLSAINMLSRSRTWPRL